MVNINLGIKNIQNKPEIEKIFNENQNLVNKKLVNQYYNLYNGNISELESDLLLILYKASIGWIENKVGEKEYKSNGNITHVYFSYHYYKYVLGYMKSLNIQKKEQKLKEQNERSKEIHELEMYFEEMNQYYINGIELPEKRNRSFLK